MLRRITVTMCMTALSVFAADPSIEPSAGPTMYEDNSLPPTNCLEWVLGYSEESCSLTCSRVSRFCDAQYLSNIITETAFDDMVSSAHFLRDQHTPGISATELCTKGINYQIFAHTPSLFTYELVTPEGAAFQTYCNYPTSLSEVTADCDAKYTDSHPTQLFCPCIRSAGEDCNPSIAPTEMPTVAPTVAPTGCFVWVLGATGDSCDTACADVTVAGTCVEDVLQAASGLVSFDELVANSYVIPTPGYGAFRPNTTTEFCTLSIQDLGTIGGYYDSIPHTPFAVGSIDSQLGNQFACFYPNAVTGVTGDCQTSYASPLPGQRFCPCQVPDCTAFETTYHAL